jgi:transposase-like protein
MKKTEQLKDALQLFCPNLDCPARGKIGGGNLVSHGKKRERYKCKTCKKTLCIR